MPDATALIAAYDAADTLTPSIVSARSQVGLDVEAIVVDDRSNDATADIAAAAGARVYRLNRNGGPAAARNKAIDAAGTPWLAVLDADDRMAPGRLARMIALADSTGADVVLGNFQAVDEAGRGIGGPFLSGAEYTQAQEWSMDRFMYGTHGCPSVGSYGYLKPLFRHAFLDDHGLRYDPTLRNGEDCHMIYACLAAGAKVVYAPWPDYYYAHRKGSVSHRAEPAHVTALIAADDRFVGAHGPALSAQARILFAKRRRYLLNLRDSERVLRAMKALRPGPALAALAQNPMSGGRVTRQLIEAGRKRLKLN